MSDKSELKAELERKKQRLAQIREEKKRKEEERKKKEVSKLELISSGETGVNTIQSLKYLHHRKYVFVCVCVCVCCCERVAGLISSLNPQADGRKEGASPPQDDSDLERKRREAEVLLQSMGITPDSAMGENYGKCSVVPLCLV